MPSINNPFGIFIPNQNEPEVRVPTPFREYYNLMLESQRVTEKIQNCGETIENYYQDCIEVETNGMTKTGKYVHDMHGATHDTSFDCAMGDGSMTVGRERAAEANYAAGYTDAVHDMQKLMNSAVSCGVISVNPPWGILCEVPQIPQRTDNIPVPYGAPTLPTSYSPSPVYYPHYGYYWY